VIKSAIGDSTTVGGWLGSLDKSQQDAFKHYAKNATSDIEAYLYARFLKPGYQGSIADLTAWVNEKYPKEDLRKVLLIEIDSLKTDLHNVRQMTLTRVLDHATAATKIAVLQKEIRSHIQAVRQMTDGLDRRGLLLAGADRCMRELMNSFEDVPSVYSLLEDASIVVWSVLEKEEKS
jgi:type II secretory pathway pseudopilin PulG